MRVLRYPIGPASDQEIAEAALQFVRKVSGMRVPAAANSAAFEAAVREVSSASKRLLEALPARRTMPKPRPRAPRTP
ncbi:MAG: DUF2277 family protein [Chloroflexi bacterium]|nr:DUF2277 family protein [Chloroflexota bacterium]